MCIKSYWNDHAARAVGADPLSAKVANLGRVVQVESTEAQGKRNVTRLRCWVATGSALRCPSLHKVRMVVSIFCTCWRNKIH